MAVVRRDDELLGEARLGSEVVVGSVARFGTQAVDLAGIDILPVVDILPAVDIPPVDTADLLDSFAACHPDSLVVVGFAIEIEAGLLGKAGHRLD